MVATHEDGGEENMDERVCDASHSGYVSRAPYGLSKLGLLVQAGDERYNPPQHCNLDHSPSYPLAAFLNLAVGRASELSMLVSLRSLDMTGFQRSGKSSRR